MANTPDCVSPRRGRFFSRCFPTFRRRLLALYRGCKELRCQLDKLRFAHLDLELRDLGAERGPRWRRVHVDHVAARSVRDPAEQAVGLRARYRESGRSIGRCARRVGHSGAPDRTDAVLPLSSELNVCGFVGVVLRRGPSRRQSIHRTSGGSIVANGRLDAYRAS